MFDAALIIIGALPGGYYFAILASASPTIFEPRLEELKIIFRWRAAPIHRRDAYRISPDGVRSTARATARTHGFTRLSPALSFLSPPFSFDRITLGGSHMRHAFASFVASIFSAH